MVPGNTYVIHELGGSMDDPDQHDRVTVLATSKTGEHGTGTYATVKFCDGAVHNLFEAPGFQMFWVSPDHSVN